MRSRALVVIAGIGACLLAGRGAAVRAAGGQPPAADAPPAVFRSAVDVVQVDVSVLDKNRKPVRGLTSNDFTVLEDGKPRPIMAFTPVDLPPRTPPAAGPAPASWTHDVAPDVATNAAPEEGRLVVIMFDWSIRPEDQADARRIATAAVNNMGPGDQAAVVFSNPASTAGTPQNFTADRARLLEAIGRPMAAAQVSESSTDPSHGDRRNLDGVMLDDPEGYESADCGCRRCVMEEITEIADLVRDVPGRRKVLLFIGSFFQGYEPTLPTGAIPPPPGVSPFRPPPPPAPPLDFAAQNRPFNLWPGWCAGVLQATRNDMERATGLANLTIDAIDPAGLAGPGDDPMGGTTQFSMKRLDDLHIVPDATGGRTVVNTNEPESQVPSILDESGSYYLIGFSRANGLNDGTLHSIDVKVKRSGVDVRTRRGYYATDELVAASAPEKLPIAKSLDRVLPDAAIPLTATAAAFAAAGTPAAGVAVVIDVNNPVVTPPAGGGAGASPLANTHDSVLAAMFDATGHSVASSQQTITLTRRAGSSGPYEIFARLPSDPGRYEVRVAVDGEAEQRGTVYTFVDVPDFAKDPLSLSGLLVHAEPPVPAPPPDVFGGLVPFAPTAKRTFAPADRVTAFLDVYEAASGPTSEAALDARVLDATGRSVLDEPSTIPADTFAGGRAAPYRVDLPLATLAPGGYLLSVTATRDKTVARRDLRFTVVAGAPANAATPATPAGASAAAPSARAPVAEAPAARALDGVLQAVGRYLDGYGRSLANVVAEESYVQVVDAIPVTRRLQSDVVFMTDTQANWVAFRDVFQMDGKAVRDRDDRLAKLLGTGASPSARQQATRIAQESARFNLNVDGVSVNRTLNVPISALLFLQAQNQHRSAFKLDHVETANGREVATVEFEETAMPRLIGSSDNTAMHGTATIDVETGRVIHTELTYATRAHLVYPNGAVDAETNVRIRVSFADDAKLGLWLPASMDEQYLPTMLSDSRGRAGVPVQSPLFGGAMASAVGAPLPMLSARATYANFRQFGVNVGTDVK